MDYLKTYEFWKNDPFFDEATRAELAALTDEKEIKERFYKDLEFGTGGLRGIIGAGSNRINKYNVRRATTGFAQFLLEKYGEEAKKRGIAVAFDCRNFSREFAKETALTMAALGIPVYLYTILSATPLLSFTVRYLNCVGGVVITASHNPAEYNGYKAYDETGCQLLPDDADRVIAKVNAVDIRSTKVMDYEEAKAACLVKEIGEDVMEKFLDAVEAQAHPLDAAAKEALKIVYTPLHGAGNKPVRDVLARQGYTGLTVVEEQCVEDGNFPTVDYPNPEERGALKMGMELADRIGADLVLATDPDSDREGIAVRHNGELVLLTGNQTGALLVNYVIERRKAQLNPKSTLIKTIVTGELGADIAKKNGCQVKNVLTGFKFIGDIMNGFEKDGSGEYIFGYEESYGVLIGTHARDKDAVVGSLIICEMAAYYKAQGKSLVDVLDSLYAEFGYYNDVTTSYTLKGLDGAMKIKAISAHLREVGKDLMEGITEIKDYKDGCDGLPKSDVLKYFFADGSWMAVRPSGTEPKIKVYYGVKRATKEDALAVFNARKAVMDGIVNG
ncbi:MAG: phospho-sugar mutase [Firmicutes bacterium]|nr:phospho-sugar mutase [Bacillota bacterium]